MKKSKFMKIAACIALVLLVVFVTSGHIHLPSHGNRENKNFEKAVVAYVSSQLTNGENVEFVEKFLSEDYKENNEVRYAATVVYYVVSRTGGREKHTARVICNEDKDRIIGWKELVNPSEN